MIWFVSYIQDFSPFSIENCLHSQVKTDQFSFENFKLIFLSNKISIFFFCNWSNISISLRTTEKEWNSSTFFSNDEILKLISFLFQMILNSIFY
jgi:hypothetical protein